MPYNWIPDDWTLTADGNTWLLTCSLQASRGWELVFQCFLHYRQLMLRIHSIWIVECIQAAVSKNAFIVLKFASRLPYVCSLNMQENGGGLLWAGVSDHSTKLYRENLNPLKPRNQNACQPKRRIVFFPPSSVATASPPHFSKMYFSWSPIICEVTLHEIIIWRRQDWNLGKGETVECYPPKMKDAKPNMSGFG